MERIRVGVVSKSDNFGDPNEHELVLVPSIFGSDSDKLSLGIGCWSILMDKRNLISAIIIYGIS